MISPGFNSCEHTLNTLRYADRYTYDVLFTICQSLVTELGWGVLYCLIVNTAELGVNLSEGSSEYPTLKLHVLVLLRYDCPLYISN